MRSLGFSLVLEVTALLLGVAPSESVAQRARPMMSPFQPGMGMSQPRMVNSFSPMMASGGSGMSAMSSGGYGGYQMPSSGYSDYQTPPGGYYSSSYSSNASSQKSPLSRVPTADDIEVSGPLDTPPPHRAIVRLRLPHTWADVGFDGQKVDSMGQARTYVTPELSRPRTFEVTATWKKNGRTVWLMEEVTVKAGQIRTLDFTSGN